MTIPKSNVCSQDANLPKWCLLTSHNALLYFHGLFYSRVLYLSVLNASKPNIYDQDCSLPKWSLFCQVKMLHYISHLEKIFHFWVELHHKMIGAFESSAALPVLPLLSLKTSPSNDRLHFINGADSQIWRKKIFEEKKYIFEEKIGFLWPHPNFHALTQNYGSMWKLTKDLETNLR